MAIVHDTRTTHTITIDIPDDIIGRLEQGDDVEVQLRSRALNRLPAPIRLSYATIQRLTRDST